MTTVLSCPRKLTPLGCAQSGVSWSTCSWGHLTDRLHLRSGGGAAFPVPTNGESYWVDIGGGACGDCVRAEVLGRVGDVLTLAPTANYHGVSVPGGARVAYATNSPEHIHALASELAIEAVSPLRFDCATRRLWIDCEALQAMIAQPCAS